MNGGSNLPMGNCVGANRNNHMNHMAAPSPCLGGAVNNGLSGNGNNLSQAQCYRGPGGMNLMQPNGAPGVPPMHIYPPARSYSYPNVVQNVYHQAQNPGVVYAVSTPRNNLLPGTFPGSVVGGPGNYPRVNVIPSCPYSNGGYTTYPHSLPHHMNMDGQSNGLPGMGPPAPPVSLLQQKYGLLRTEILLVSCNI